MRDRSSRSRPVRVLVSLLVLHASLLTSLLLSEPAAANPTHPGKWTNAFPWGGTAVNLILLPGGSTGKHSQLLWWTHDDTARVLGGLWGWSAPDAATDSTINQGIFPAASFDTLHLEDPPLAFGDPRNIFCAGQTMLEDGRLLITGGTALDEAGIKSTLLFDPSGGPTHHWTLADTMFARRWYPDNALLPSGVVVTTAGSASNHFIAVGGRVGGAQDTTTRMLQRYVVAPGDTCEPNAVPTKSNIPSVGLPLAPFSDAAATDVCCSAMFAFGGKNASGVQLAQAITIQRQRAEFSSDYTFTWAGLDASQNAFSPVARSGAGVAVINNGDLVLIGGTTGTGPLAEVWRGRILGNAIKWLRVSPSGDALPALHGLGAIYDPSVNRVFFFGGSSDTSETASNGDVYSLSVDDTSFTSTQCVVTRATVVSGTGPGPHSYGSLSYEPNDRAGMPGDATNKHRRAFFFGGRTATNSLDDGLYALWFKSATEVVWQPLAPPQGAPKPGARAHHAAAFVNDAAWLVVSGGEIASGTSNELWAFDVSGNNHWEPLPNLPLAVRGQSGATLGPEPEFSRLPDVFDPTKPMGSQWTTLANSPHWQEWYSFGFAAPHLTVDAANTYRVFYAGPEQASSTLAVTGNSGQWTQTDTTGGLGTFKAGSAVMYKPGKVMKCGTRDTGGTSPGDVLGNTSVIDLTVASATWVNADTMIHRRNHNLVILADGEVAAIGGGRWGGNGLSTDANCVKQVQIWNPDTLQPTGHWYGRDGMVFDSANVRRHYHSTAILLPDGRILSAGGNKDGDPDPDQLVATIYSPYYLFDANGSPRSRPVIQGAPTRVAYGERFSLSMGPSDVISKVTLIRPGATTHAFDQNQRYVPLNFTSVSPRNGLSEQRYLVTAPADSFEALPGDYLLFALNSAGTPAIAKWIKLRATNADTTRPTPVMTLAKDCSTDATQVILKWPPPCADSLGPTVPCPGPAAQYNIRYSIGSSMNWLTSQLVPGVPLPLDPTTPLQSVTVTGLTANTTYSFAMVSKNYSSRDGNWSAMSNVLTLVTHAESCGGSGGGGGCCQDGGLVALRTGSAYSLQPGDAAAGPDVSFLENTLLANVAPGLSSTDILPLRYGPKWTTSGARIRLSQAGALGTRFSSVRLVAVSQTPGEELFVAGDKVLSGTLTDPARVKHADGRDLTALFAADSSFDGRDGDTLLVDFVDPTPARIALRTSHSQLVIAPDRTGIDIQCETAQGWQTVAHHDPRELPSTALYDVPSPGRIRLVFLGEHRLVGVSRFVPGTAPSVTAYEPTSVVHSRYGDLAATLGTSGASLVAGDNVLADFAVTRDQSAGVAWFLQVTGEHTATARSTSAAVRPVPGPAAPLRFALDQNRPNPFDSRTEVGFELPVRSAVRLEVFDLLGRRVATLANATYEPGRYSVSWDRQGNRGTRVPAGVYTCRFTAGEHQEQRRMVVFP